MPKHYVGHPLYRSLAIHFLDLSFDPRLGFDFHASKGLLRPGGLADPWVYGDLEAWSLGVWRPGGLVLGCMATWRPGPLASCDLESLLRPGGLALGCMATWRPGPWVYGDQAE